MYTNDVNFTIRPTCGKLFKNKKLLKSEGNHFCSDDRQWFPYPHAKFKARFIFEPISSGRKLQRHALKKGEQLRIYEVDILNMFAMYVSSSEYDLGNNVH